MVEDTAYIRVVEGSIPSRPTNQNKWLKNFSHINAEVVNIEAIVRETATSLGKTVYELLNGGCLAFALALQKKTGGTLRYLVNEYHVVLDLNGKLYDASGNVTKQYSNSKYITEDELMKRRTLINELSNICT